MIDIQDQNIERRLRAKNLRPTRARKIIMRLFSDNTNHLSCEEIVKKVLSEEKDVGQATVYQNVGLLAEKGVLTSFKGPNGILLHDSDGDEHHHLICKKCGEITDVHINGQAQDLQPHPFKTEINLNGWDISSSTVEFYGLCPNCR